MKSIKKKPNKLFENHLDVRKALLLLHHTALKKISITLITLSRYTLYTLFIKETAMRYKGIREPVPSSY
jgi:hypothetical protein